MARHELSIVLASAQVVLLFIQIFGLFNLHLHVASLVDKMIDVHPKENWQRTAENFSSQIKGLELSILDSKHIHSDSSILRTSQVVMPIQTARESIGSIMSRTGTDKLSRHAYDRYYELHLREFRDKENLCILEIGAQSGRSIQLWSEYFTRPAAIHGVSYGQDTVNVDQKQVVCDWNPAACDKVKIFNGDQSDPKFLKTITDEYKYDIIIDDGSHFPPHQITSLKYLFSVLNPGGLYILEDLETSYWNAPGANLYGYSISAGIGASPRVNAVEKLKQFVDVLMRFHMAHPNLQILSEDEKMFSLTFGQGLAIIRKSTDEDLQHVPNVPEAPVIHSGIDNWASECKKSNP
jgi:hypothetical protein